MLKYKLPPTSPEQQQIITAVADNNNVIINSVAGSGKTTTALHICLSQPKKKVLILTYNARLKIESKEKVRDLGLRNVEIHSYHAFCVRYYYEKGNRDDGIDLVIRDNFIPKNSFNFDIVILDEQQDMTPLFYKFVRKILNDNGNLNDIQICLFGDIYQNIYTYAGSDERYLKFANKIFPNLTKEWKVLNISTSYRITNQIANFVNIMLLKTNRLKAIKDGPKVQYIITNTFGDNYVYTEIKSYLDQGYKPEDIFVLGVSIKKGEKMSPICKLENKLVNEKIPCHAAPSNDAQISDEIIKGKICFSSFHQVKGMERKICIVYGFDKSYFDFYNKSADPNVCPNVLYVALTRASEKLLLIHDYQNKYLPFIDKDLLETVCKVVYNKNLQDSHTPKCKKNVPIGVCDLIKNKSNDDLDYIFNFIEYDIINIANNPIKLQSKVVNKKDLCEDVSDINGITIPGVYEFNNSGKLSILELINNYLNSINLYCISNHEGKIKHIGISSDSKLPEKHENKIIKIYNDYLNKEVKVADILYVANVYNSMLTGFIAKREQIDNYGWIDNKNLNASLEIMKKYIGDKSLYEQPIRFNICNKEIVGAIDAVDINNDTIWEFKCVNTISREHILQLVIYSYIYENTMIYMKDKANEKCLLDLNNKNSDELIDFCKNNNINCGKIKNKDKLVELIFGLLKELDIVKERKYKLLNILTEEIIEVKYKKEYEIIIDYLINKGEDNKVMDDDEFIDNCSNILDVDCDSDNGFI
jgi:hypothetical protein